MLYEKPAIIWELKILCDYKLFKKEIITKKYFEINQKKKFVGCI